MIKSAKKLTKTAGENHTTQTTGGLTDLPDITELSIVRKQRRKTAELLTIADDRERSEALSRGEMVFYGPRTEVRCVFQMDWRDRDLRHNYLVMPFNLGEGLYALRYSPHRRQLVVTQKKGGVEELMRPKQFIHAEPNNMSHMVMKQFEGSYITLPAVMIARDHALAVEGRAVADGIFLRLFLKLFARAGYVKTAERPLNLEEKKRIKSWIEPTKTLGGDLESAGIMDSLVTMQCRGWGDERNNLGKYFRLIAVDRKSNKIRSYYYENPGRKDA